VNSRGTGSVAAAGIIGGILVLVIFIAGIGLLTSFKSTDPGQTCVVQQGGMFDGRNLTEVRQGGQGPKPIGIWNKQHCLPATERDSNDVIEGRQTFPTRDSVQVIVDGQALFTLTNDPDRFKQFYKSYGRRSWDGKNLTSDTGWLNFLRQRVQPAILSAQREVIGGYDCTELNNLCQYVQNPQIAVENGPKKTVNNTQNIVAAQQALADKIKEQLHAAFKNDYFENIRYQNLRIRFEPEVASKITEAQSLRTQAANAKLEAQRKVAEAKGNADKHVAEAEGSKRAAIEQEKAYRSNPTQRQIDKIKAFCGEEGCDPKVIGGNLSGILANLGR
jgi:hypothetical protein